MPSNIKVFKLDVEKEDVFIFKKNVGSNFFITTSDSLAISKYNFFALLKFMLYRGFIDPKSLEGLLSEYTETI